MLEKQILTLVDGINELGVINVKEITRIMDNGIKISDTFNRHVVSPGDDISNEDIKVIAIANAIWTEDVIINYSKLNRVI